MKIIEIKRFIGHKRDGTFATYNINIYDECDPKIKKKTEAIEKKLVSKLSNKKIFDFWYCDIIPFNDKIKRKQGDKM